MLNTTKQALSAILAADPSVTPEQRKAALCAVACEPTATTMALPRVIRRDEAARILSVSVKRVDQLARAGHLRRVQVPGTGRALGIAEPSLRAILEGVGAA